MFCTKCGNEIKDGFKFCPKCGAPAFVAKEKEANKVKDVEKKEEKKGVTEGATKAAVKPKSAESSEEASTSSLPHLIPNPLISQHLRLEKVVKKAKKGDKRAIRELAFRYEMGIGVEKNVKKADELYGKCGGKNEEYLNYVSLYLFNIELSQNLCVTSE